MTRILGLIAVLFFSTIALTQAPPTTPATPTAQPAPSPTIAPATVNPPSTSQIMSPPTPPKTPSPFNEQWARLQIESQTLSSDCKAFETALATNPQTPAEKAEVLKKWPGFPGPQVQAVQMLLRSKNPPADLDGGRFLEDYGKFNQCDFVKTVGLVQDLQTAVKDASMTPADRKHITDILNDYMQLITNKPGSMQKVAVAVSLAEFLSQGGYVNKLARKDHMIHHLREQSTAKAVPIQQALNTFANIPTSAVSAWGEFHEAEKMRMELARIVFFP
jgi:hypothetical protein